MIYNTLNQMKAKPLDACKYADGQGLWLVKRNRVAGKRVPRLVVHGRRWEIAGPWSDVSIAEAQRRTEESRKTCVTALIQ